MTSHSWVIVSLLAAAGAAAHHADLCQAQSLSSPPSEVSPQGYEATGTAPVSSDAVRARDRALQGAMQRALEQAVTQAAPEVRGRLYLVTARAHDYVPTYRVLSEGETDGLFQVRIAAQVDLPRLLHDLQAGALTTPRRQVRAVVLVCPGTADRPGGSAALAAVRDALQVRAEVPPTSSCGPQFGAAMAAAGAQAAVLVSADSAPADEIRGTSPPLYGAHARVRLALYGAGGKAIEEKTQEADASAAAPGPAADRALSSAALLGLGWLQGALGGVLPGTADEGVTVALEGLGGDGNNGYQNYRLLLRTLAALPGVRAAEPRRFGAGQAEVLLRTAGLAEPLGAALGRTPIAGLHLQVMPQGPGRLRVLVAPDSALPPVSGGVEPAGGSPALPSPAAGSALPPAPLPPPPPLPNGESDR